MNAPIDRIEAFLVLARGLGAARTVDADYRLYERLKKDFQRDFPGAAPLEYERVMRAISKAAGV